jgi:acylphosphatase
VEAVVEGNKGQVEQLIEAIRQGPRASRVDESRVEWETPTREFLQFGVKRSL